MRINLLKQLAVVKLKQLVFTFDIMKFKQNGRPGSSKLSFAHRNNIQKLNNFVEILENKGLQKPSQHLIKKNLPLKEMETFVVFVLIYIPPSSQHKPEGAEHTSFTN